MKTERAQNYTPQLKSLGRVPLKKPNVPVISLKKDMNHLKEQRGGKPMVLKGSYKTATQTQREKMNQTVVLRQGGEYSPDEAFDMKDFCDADFGEMEDLGRNKLNMTLDLS